MPEPEVRKKLESVLQRQTKGSTKARERTKMQKRAARAKEANPQLRKTFQEAAARAKETNPQWRKTFQDIAANAKEANQPSEETVRHQKARVHGRHQIARPHLFAAPGPPTTTHGARIGILGGSLIRSGGVLGTGTGTSTGTGTWDWNFYLGLRNLINYFDSD